MAIALSQLRCLVAVHEHGTVTRAAAALNLSQPAVTRSLQDLQDALALTVLRRAGRRLELTEAGRTLLEHARAVVAQETQATADLAAWMRSRRVTVTLASSAMPISTSVPQAIAMVSATHPEARIRVVESVYPDVMRLFRDESIDLAIGPIPEKPPGEGYRVELLGEMPMCVAMSPNHRLRHARSVRELRDARWAGAGSVGVWEGLARHALGQAGIALPRTLVQCESVTCALQLLEHSELLAIVPLPLARQWARAGRVAIAPVEEPMPGSRIGLCQPSHATQTNVARSLYSALRLTARTLFEDVSDAQGHALGAAVA